MRLIPALSPHLRWESEVAQYDRPDVPDRSPGVHAWTVPPSDSGGTVIECLLHYDEHGTLDGILNYFPRGTPMLDRPRDFMVLVDPQRRRQGIGTALIREAQRRWHIEVWGQALTPDGLQLMAALEPDTDPRRQP